MAFEYVDVEEAIQRDGLRMVVVGNVPSPWGEAAKGIFHVKGVDWVAVRTDHRNKALHSWAGSQSGPVVIYGDEAPRSGWAEILLLAERLSDTPALLPSDPAERALVFGLSHELCGEAGLAWSRRLQVIHAGLAGTGGFPKRVAQYLGMKYGYRPETGSLTGHRVAEILKMLVSRLKAQRESGSAYYVGKTLSAVDIYSATVAATFSPLPEPDCKMDPTTRAVFETNCELTSAALDPIFFAHRDMMYREHLELPLSL
ncbi:MAG: hypothetical protein JKY56_17725 [Kofleriaceae bacterium]|nr:hypothetical protein [Kofleriaceae bacterium]